MLAIFPDVEIVRDKLDPEEFIVTVKTQAGYEYQRRRAEGGRFTGFLDFQTVFADHESFVVKQRLKEFFTQIYDQQQTDAAYTVIPLNKVDVDSSGTRIFARNSLKIATDIFTPSADRPMKPPIATGTVKVIEKQEALNGNWWTKLTTGWNNLKIGDHVNSNTAINYLMRVVDMTDQTATIAGQTVNSPRWVRLSPNHPLSQGTQLRTADELYVKKSSATTNPITDSGDVQTFIRFTFEEINQSPVNNKPIS